MIFPPVISSTTVILFCVNVPVLSTHKTVADPRVSIAGIFLVRTSFFDILHAPRAMNIVKTTGNSSGNTAMASVNPARSPPSQSVFVNPYIAKTTTQRAKPKKATLLTSLEI